jgi:EAL domain-containing protein (putative c-di-GMP-specific phosphodiesterase class I)
VVAERVETTDQAAAVDRLGCTHVQGFLYSPPVFPEELFSAATRCAELGSRPTAGT